MLKERHQVFVSLLAASDTAVVAAAHAVTIAVVQACGGLPADAWSRQDILLPFAGGTPIVLASMAVIGLYRPRRDRMFFSELFDIVKVALISGALFVICVQAFSPALFRQHQAATIMTALPLTLIGFLTVHRWIFRTVLHHIRRRGWNLRHFAIIGTGRLGQIAFHTFLRNSWTGINCAYFVSHHDTTRRRQCLGRPVYGGLDELEATLEKHRIDGVVIALPQSRSYLLPNIMMQLERFAVDVRIIPDISPRYMPINLNVHELDGMPVLTMRQSPLNGFAAMHKRAIDIVLATMAMAFFALPMSIIAILIRLESRGPAIFRQERVSIGGKVFRIYKFRTMRVVTTDETAPAASVRPEGTSAWTKRDDPRITRIGRFLRRTSLDELPQLLNVLTGDMSLVGPRPERLDLIEDFRKDWRGYMLRQNIKPGMTGWAQVNGLRGDTSLRKRLQYDLYYIRNWSLGFDLRILILTVFRGFRHPNAH